MPSIPIKMHDGSILEHSIGEKDFKSPKESFMKQETRNRLMRLPSRCSSFSNISVFETKEHLLEEKSSNKCFSNFKTHEDVTELRNIPIIVENSKSAMKTPRDEFIKEEKKSGETKTKKSDIYRAERVYLNNLDEDETDKTEENKKLTYTVYHPSPALRGIQDNAHRNKFLQDMISTEKSLDSKVILPRLI